MSRPPLPNAADRIPALNVTVGEVDRACYVLVDHGWAGGIPFDEAVKALAEGERDPTIARHMALGAAVERVFAYAGNGYDYISVTKHADRMDDGYEPSPNDRWSIESGLVTLRGTGPTLTAAIDAALRDPEEAER